MLSLSTITYGHGQPLVLLHGWGFSKQIWSPLLPTLTKHFQVTLVDLPGHGQSPLLPHLLSAKQVAEQLVHYTPADAHWLGWSLGGLLSLAVAEYYPQHIKQLSLVASTPKFVGSDDWQYGLSPDLLAEFSKHLQANPEKTLKSFIALQTMGSPQARQETRELQTYVHQHLPSKAGLGWGLDMLNTLDFRSTLASLNHEVHALFGAKDTLVSLKLAEYLPQHYPKVKTQVLTEAAHMPFHSHPELFFQWLLKA